MKDAWWWVGIGFACVLVAALVWILWNNRASERIVGAVVPIVVAAIGGVLLVLAFSSQPSVTHNFPAMFFYRRADLVPVHVPFRPIQNSLFLISALYQANAAALDGVPGTREMRAFHHLLQRSMVDWLALKFRGSWQMDNVRLNIQGATAELFQPVSQPAGPSTVLDSAALNARLQDNIFAAVPRGPMADQWSLPAGTRLTVRTPVAGADVGEILLSNDFADVAIRTNYSMRMGGVGQYARFIGRDPMNGDEAQITYVVRITISYSRLRPGHPMMPNIQAWATALVEELRSQFDEERIWQSARDTFMLNRLMPPQDPRVNAQNLGTIGDPPPAQPPSTATTP